MKNNRWEDPETILYVQFVQHARYILSTTDMQLTVYELADILYNRLISGESNLWRRSQS